jgi:hypothetical protein
LGRDQDRPTPQIEDKIVNLAPGMAVTVEVKTGQRRGDRVSVVAVAEISA